MKRSLILGITLMTAISAHAGSWYNHKTGTYERFEGMPPASRYPEFISQVDAAQNLYILYVNGMNKSPDDALLLVLQASVAGKE